MGIVDYILLAAVLSLMGFLFYRELFKKKKACCDKGCGSESDQKESTDSFSV